MEKTLERLTIGSIVVIAAVVPALVVHNYLSRHPKPSIESSPVPTNQITITNNYQANTNRAYPTDINDMRRARDYADKINAINEELRRQQSQKR